MKRNYDNDIKLALSEKQYQQAPERQRKNQKQDKIFLEAGPSAIETITKGESNTDPDAINAERLRHFSTD